MIYWNKDGQSYDTDTGSPNKLWASYCDSVALKGYDGEYKPCSKSKCGFYTHNITRPDCMMHCRNMIEDSLYMMGYKPNPYEEGTQMYDEYERLVDWYLNENTRFWEYRELTKQILDMFDSGKVYYNKEDYDMETERLRCHAYVAELFGGKKNVENV